MTRAIDHMVRGQEHRRCSRYQEARIELSRAARILRPMIRRPDPGIRWTYSWCRLWQAHVLYEQGALSRAMRVYSSVAGIMSECGDERGLGVAHRGLGNVCKFLGLYTDATEHYDQAIRFGNASDDRIGVAMATHNQGNVLLALEDFTRAEETYRRAARIFRQLGRRDLWLHAWVSLAEVAQRSGQPTKALRRLVRAERMGHGAETHAGFEAERLVALGVTLSSLGRIGEARAAFQRAVLLAAEVRENHTAALAQHALAVSFLDTGQANEAMSAARKGLDLTRRSGTSTELFGILHEIAAAAARLSGDWRKTARHLEIALNEQKRLATHLAKQRTQSLALQEELKRAHHETELVRVEKGRLEKALAEIARRMDKSDSTLSVETITADALAPLGLSRRETDVLLWVLRGKTNGEIAIILGCGSETIKTHLKRIFRQLDVTNRAAAASHAMQFGLMR